MLSTSVQEELHSIWQSCENPAYSDHKPPCAGKKCWSGIEKAAQIHKLQMCSTWFISPESFAASVSYVLIEEAGICQAEKLRTLKSCEELIPYGNRGCTELF